MTQQELWKSNSYFNCYPLKDFKKYDNTMKILTDTNKADLEGEESKFQKYCFKYPKNKMTDRGEPFWYNHLEKSLLEDDVKSLLVYDLAPAALHETRK